MNIVGKILAFLNLIFAVVVAGLLAMFLTTSTNWKGAHEREVRDHQATKGQLKTWIDTATKYKTDNKNLKALGSDYIKDDVRISEKKTAELLSVRNELELERNLRLKAEISQKEAEAALDRRTKDAEINRKLIEDRSQEVSKLNGDLDKAKNDLQTLKTQFITVQGRAETALEELKVTRRKLYELESTKGSDVAAAPKVMNSKAPNPPSRAVVGKVLRADGADVHVDVGLDHGVQDNNTLEVFRVNPKAEYVGVLRISKSYARESVGRLQPLAGVVRTVRAGDTVADRLDR
jgi:hypothetical protein